MYKIIIISDTFKHFQEPINEYEKRLKNNIEIIKIKPSKKSNISLIVSEETLLIKEKISKIKGYKILLYINAKEFCTQDFFNFCEDKKQTQSDIIFIVGGAYGVDLSIIQDLIDFKFSLSNMTFPHSMAYLILLEQIYRIISIKKQTGYHH